ncbi:extensin family protein [Limibaculum sp. M0105]|uniref:Extensin family protein n=1 Tax=Thermohalobaculum xanthum TaxID=2753746 RepID=A0A8J7SCT4_9RHOB|nr:extensin family protein [Thermohalobaculum xanthum]MBK0399647.1 extensin family protein [Thermohalobaculum xanthum]
MRPRARPEAATDAVKFVALEPAAVVPARLPDDSRGPQPDQFVCRDPRLAGSVIPAIGDYGAPCGVTLPVRLTSVSGIAFDTPATLDCPTARRVAHWLTGVAEPLARKHLGSRIVEVDVMGSYSCRTRNNRPGGRISEHAVGRAIDVGGFRLADGRRISVKEDWGQKSEGKFLKAVHRQSCGLFMTVLGPDADRYHHDHFHLDTARRRGNAYCR